MGTQIADVNFVSIITFSLNIYNCFIDKFYFDETFTVVQIIGFGLLVIATITEPLYKLLKTKAGV